MSQVWYEQRFGGTVSGKPALIADIETAAREAARWCRADLPWPVKHEGAVHAIAQYVAGMLIERDEKRLDEWVKGEFQRAIIPGYEGEQSQDPAWRRKHVRAFRHVGKALITGFAYALRDGAETYGDLEALVPFGLVNPYEPHPSHWLRGRRKIGKPEREQQLLRRGIDEVARVNPRVADVLEAYMRESKGLREDQRMTRKLAAERMGVNYQQFCRTFNRGKERITIFYEFLPDVDE